MAYIWPSFWQQNLTWGETNHSVEIAVRLNASARYANASMELATGERFFNETLWGNTTSARSTEEYGYAIDSKADYNADGHADLAVSAPGIYSTQRGGRVEVFYGSPDGIRGQSPGWVLQGNATQRYGLSLTHGDYNDDGVDDLVVGDPHDATPVTATPESVQVFYGGPSGLSNSPDVTLARLPANRSGWGNALAGGFDLDGDGFDDLAVGEGQPIRWMSPGCPPAINCTFIKGQVTVLWGGPGGLDFSNATLLLPPWEHNVSFFGVSLTNLGDNDGNGADELLAGSWADLRWNGTLWLFAGSPGNRSPEATWRANGTRNYDLFGWRALGGTDFSGDGIADLLVTAPYAGGGRLYQFDGLGNGSYTWAPTASVTSPSGPGGYFGMGLDLVGDTDGDGVAELVVGHPYVASDTGWAWSFPVTGLAGPPSHWLTGANGFGWVVAALGDMEGDALADFAVSAPHALIVPSSTYPGSVTVFTGTTSLLPENLTVEVGGSEVFAVPGPVSGRLQVPNFAAAIEQYIAGHPGDVSPSGWIDVPFRSSFSGGGFVKVVLMSFSYTFLPTPTGLTASGADGRVAVNLSWQLPPSSDVDSFVIWSNRSGAWQPLGTTDGRARSFLDVGARLGEVTCYRVTARDSVANLESPPSATACAAPLNPLPPPVPLNVTASPNEAGRVVDVGWTSAGDDPAYFEVWRADGNDLPSALLSAVPGSARSFSDASAVSGITYVYRVRAVSEAGLASSFSLGASAMLSNSAPPPPPTQVSVLADPGGYAARVEWLAADPAAVSSVVRYSFADRPGVTLEAGPTAGSALVIQGLRPQVDITFHVVSFDLSGRESAPSEGVTLQLIDREPPSPPPDVRIVPYPAGGALTLLWGQSTSLDVVAYRVLFFDPDRSSQFEVLAELPAGATSLFKDGLRNHVTYGLQVIAVDAEGNPSPPSDAAFGAPELQALPPTPSLDPMPPVTNQSPLEVTGSAGAGLWVELSVNAALSTVVQADASGRFSALLTLEAGDNAVWARTVDPLSTAHPEWRGSPPSPTAHTWFDADPPRVVWSRPDPRNDEATPETVIVIALSEAVVPATASITLRDADGLSWEGRLDYNETSQQLTFRPSRPLPWNVLLHVEVRATDLAGNALALHAFSFRTAAEPGTAGAPAEQGSFLAAFAPAVAFAAIATAAVALLRSRRRPGDPSALSPGEQNREGPP